MCNTHTPVIGEKNLINGPAAREDDQETGVRGIISFTFSFSLWYLLNFVPF